jgi:hypothetical protein
VTDLDRRDEYLDLIAEDERRNGHDPYLGVPASTEEPPPDDLGPDPFDFEGQVLYQLDKLRISREARRRLDTEELPRIVIPPLKRLDELLDEPDAPTPFLIDALQPADSRILLSAQYKAGKSTLRDNLIRSLVDHEPFLGRFEVCAPVRHIVVIDNELSENMVRRWMRDQGIQNTTAVSVECLRGRVGTFNVIDEYWRREWVTALRAVGCDYLILDCLRPVLDALGLDENRDAGKFLVAFDALLAEAGITAAAVVHHMGHSNERSRGDSRLQDWPDAIWKLVRENEDASSPRYFSAFGRDVDLAEGRLTFDPDSRHYVYGSCSRQDAKVENACSDVIRLLASSSEPMSKNQIETELAEVHTQKAVRDAITAVVKGKNKIVAVDNGPRNSKLHRIAFPCSECGLPVTSRRPRHESCPPRSQD